MWCKRAGLATEGRLPFVQPLSLTSFDSSPSRGASGETVHFAGTAKASPTRRGGTPSGVTERLYKGKPAHNQKSPRHDAERAGGFCNKEASGALR